ncbi:hypothetical protein Fmac_021363 [Flemingia macrophylla]|uniref:Uncharacterized protein n=1 Tax=Flemingia macrophylla TaxID=520843 RepID=A0ABD1LWU0_9FABA
MHGVLLIGYTWYHRKAHAGYPFSIVLSTLNSLSYVSETLHQSEPSLGSPSEMSSHFDNTRKGIDEISGGNERQSNSIIKPVETPFPPYLRDEEQRKMDMAVRRSEYSSSSLCRSTLFPLRGSVGMSDLAGSLLESVQVKRLVQAYIIKARWFHCNNTPTLEEYMHSLQGKVDVERMHLGLLEIEVLVCLLSYDKKLAGNSNCQVEKIETSSEVLGIDKMPR